MTREELVEEARALRAEGKTYQEIDRALGLPANKSWHFLNREASRANSRESCDRYNRRGRVALCDMED